MKYKLKWWWRKKEHEEDVNSVFHAQQRLREILQSGQKVKSAVCLRAEEDGINDGKFFLHMILK